MTRPRKRKSPYKLRRQGSSKRPIPPPRRTGFRFRWRWLILIILFGFLGHYVISLDEKVREQFEGKRWALPARVYARPLELYTGMRLSAQALSEELNALGYQKSRQLDESGQWYQRGKNFTITTRAFKFWDATDPSRTVRVRLSGNIVQSINELQPNRRLALLRLPPKLIGKIYPAHNEDRILVRLDKVPPSLTEALVAMEDRNFYEHSGLSIRGLVRAFLANLKAGGWVQGGSTLTQQLVKNFYLTNERTLKRKFNEAIMALLLEWHYSKEQILEAYMNEVFLGQDGNRAIHGMGMGARFYFNRPLEELKLPQLALLITLVRGASIYNPRKHPKRARDRRNLVLDMMAQQDKISLGDAKVAKEAPLGVAKKVTESRFPYPAFMDLVRYQLHQEYDEKALRSKGLQIFTTLDPYVQKLGERVMKRGLRKLERTHRKARNLEGAMIVTSSENGELLALINGKKPQYAGFNRPLNAVRQIGSLAKVAVYLAALEQNHIYDLTTLLDDIPFTWEDKKTGEIWKPQNYDRVSHGRVPLYNALSYSYNLATVHLGMELGLAKIKDTMKRLGIERDFKMYPSVLLGSINLSPLEVAQMYQTIASGGFRIPVRGIRNVLDHEGKPLNRYALSVEERFDAASVYLLNYALKRALRKGTGRKVAKTLPSKMVLAGKTGTSNDLRDSWFAGFSRELLAVTWVGRDDNKPMGLSGGTGALVVWSDFIKAIRPKAKAPITPKNIEWRSVGAERMPFIVDQRNTAQSMINYQ